MYNYKAIRDPDVAKSEAKTGIHVILPPQELQKVGRNKLPRMMMKTWTFHS